MPAIALVLKEMGEENRAHEICRHRGIRDAPLKGVSRKRTQEQGSSKKITCFHPLAAFV
jgi:hypothetical protein